MFPLHSPILKAQNLPSGDSTGNRYTAVKQPVYNTIRLQSARPVIDGKLDDECWKNGTWGGRFHQWIPVEGAEPTYPTEFNIQYDDRNLYVAMRGMDGEPGKINRMSGVRDGDPVKSAALQR